MIRRLADILGRIGLLLQGRPIRERRSAPRITSPKPSRTWFPFGF